jgi:hypothetical protein
MKNQESKFGKEIDIIPAHRGFLSIVRRLKNYYFLTTIMITLWLIFFLLEIRFLISKIMIIFILISFFIISLKFLPSILFKYKYCLFENGILGWIDEGKFFIKTKTIFYPYDNVKEIIYLNNLKEFNKYFKTKESQQIAYNQYRINSQIPSIIIFTRSNDILVFEFNDKEKLDIIKQFLDKKISLTGPVVQHDICHPRSSNTL